MKLFILLNEACISLICGSRWKVRHGFPSRFPSSYELTTASVKVTNFDSNQFIGVSSYFGSRIEKFSNHYNVLYFSQFTT